MDLITSLWRLVLLLRFTGLNVSFKSLCPNSSWRSLSLDTSLPSILLFRLFIILISWFSLIGHFYDLCGVSLRSWLSLISIWWTSLSCINTPSRLFEPWVVLYASTHYSQQVGDSISTQLLSNLPLAYRFSVGYVKIDQFNELLLLL